MPDGFTLTSPSRLGAANDGANRLQLFKTTVVGEVLKTFEAEDVFSPMSIVRQITSGKSAIFPFIGNIGGAFHTPGTSLAATNIIKAAEKIISVDGQYIAHTWITNLDEAMDDYNLRSLYTQELARALYRSMADRLARVFVRAARTVGVLDSDAISSLSTYKNYGASGATPSDHTNVSKLYNAGLNMGSTTAANLLNAIWTAVQIMDEKNVPTAGRYTLVRPAEFYLLLNTSGSSAGIALNKDWGGSGSYADGMVGQVAGTSIVKTNYLPSANVTTEAFSNVNPGVGTHAQTLNASSVANAETYNGNNYNGDFRGTKALVVQKGAVGTVKLLDIATEVEYYAMNQATLLLAKFAMGHGVLRPECAVEITQGRLADGTATTTFLPTAG